MTDDPFRPDVGENWIPPKYALSAVIYAEREDGQILLLQRSGFTSFAGQWFLPGGAVEPGEPPDEAARRELLEESGLETTEEPEMIGSYYMNMYGHDFIQLSYRARVTGEVRVSDEHTGSRWTDPAEMRAFLSDDVIKEIAGTSEKAEQLVLAIRDDLDRYLRRIGRTKEAT